MVSKLTPEAEIGLNTILEYLHGEFGQKFANQYFEDCFHIRFILETQPEGFPIAIEQNGIRKLVFRRRTTIYYRIIDVIEILAIIDNRKDFNPDKIQLS